MSTTSTAAIAGLSDQIERLATDVLSPADDGSALLAWQPLGVPLDVRALAADPFGAAEALDLLVDTTARVFEGVYYPDPMPASLWYELVELDLHPSLRSRSTCDASMRRATVPTPADWWDPSARGNWVSHTANSAFGAEPSTGPAAGRDAGSGTWSWQLLPPALEWMVGGGLAATERTQRRPAAARESLVGRARHVASLAGSLRAAPVTASHVRVSFEYCTVALSRPWWDGSRVARSNPSGWTASGPGVYPTVPTGFVLVRDLMVSGAWTDDDLMAIGSSAALGPLSLLGRTVYSDGSMFVPGTQLVAWVVQALPPAATGRRQPVEPELDTERRIDPPGPQRLDLAGR